MEQTQLNSTDRAVNRHSGFMNKGKLVGGALDGVAEFAFRRMEHPDEHMGVSLAAAGATAAAWYFFAPLMWTKTAADVAGGLADMATNADRQQYAQALSAGKQTFGGNFMDDAFNATNRQRSVAAIHNSKLNARSFLGQEARALHRY